MPRRRDFAETHWHGYLAGVGGMGIGVSAATLVRAGHREGYHVVFSDKNGLAIRNGGVYSHITFLKSATQPISPITPYGKADLMLGIDILEAARGLDPKGNLRVGGPRTRAIVNRQKTPTIHTLLGTDDFCVETLEDGAPHEHRCNRVILAPTFRIFQNAPSGPSFTPMSSCSASRSSAANCRSRSPAWSGASRKPWAAPRPKTGSHLNWAARSRTTPRWPLPSPLSRAITTSWPRNPSASSAPGRQGERLAQQYWQLVTRAMEKLTLDVAHQSILAQRIYDLIQYEDVAYRGAICRPPRAPACARHEDTSTLPRRKRRSGTCIASWRSRTRSTSPIYAQQRGKIRARPRALQCSSRAGRQDHPPPFESAGVRGRRAARVRFKMRTRPWMLKLMRRAKFMRRAFARAGMRRKRISATGTSISPSSSPPRAMRRPTRRG